MNKNLEIILCFVFISLAYTLKIKIKQIGELGFERRLPEPTFNESPSCSVPSPRSIPTNTILPNISPILPRPSRNNTLFINPTPPFNTSDLISSIQPPRIPRVIPMPSNTTNATEILITSPLPQLNTSDLTPGSQPSTSPELIPMPSNTTNVTANVVPLNTSDLTPSTQPSNIPRFVPLPINTTNTTSNLVTSPPPTGGLIIDVLPSEQPANITGESSDQILVPPFIRENLPREEMKIIPINFWLSANNQSITRDFILLRDRNNMAISCQLNGDVSFTKRTENDTTQYWIPEIIGENIIRLRSYNGGYLEYDSDRNKFICSNKIHNFKNLFNVFLSRRNGLCLLLKGTDTRFIAHSTDNLNYQNLTMNLERFCFFGDDETSRDSTNYYGYPANISHFMGGLPNEGAVRMSRPIPLREEPILNQPRPLTPLGSRTPPVRNVTREREMNYTDELMSHFRNSGDLPPWRRTD